jgi:hypothetical protein
LEEERKRTLRNFTVNWSPFADGNLQFNIAYNEGTNSQNDGRDRLFIPSLRWNISRLSSLDLAYQLLKSESTAGETETRGVTATVRIVL